MTHDECKALIIAREKPAKDYKELAIKLAQLLEWYEESPSSELWIKIQATAREVQK